LLKISNDGIKVFLEYYFPIGISPLEKVTCRPFYIIPSQIRLRCPLDMVSQILNLKAQDYGKLCILA